VVARIALVRARVRVRVRVRARARVRVRVGVGVRVARIALVQDRLARRGVSLVDETHHRDIVAVPEQGQG